MLCLIHHGDRCVVTSQLLEVCCCNTEVPLTNEEHKTIPIYLPGK